MTHVRVESNCHSIYEIGVDSGGHEEAEIVHGPWIAFSMPKGKYKHWLWDDEDNKWVLVKEVIGDSE